MKRFLSVLIASMFLASAAYAADDMKKTDEKKDDSKDAKVSKDAKASKDAKDAKAKAESRERFYARMTVTVRWPGVMAGSVRVRSAKGACPLRWSNRTSQPVLRPSRARKPSNCSNPSFNGSARPSRHTFSSSARTSPA